MDPSHQDPDADTASDKEDDDDKDNDKDNDREKKEAAAEEEKMNQSSDLSSWVNLSVDMAEWEVLLKQLEDTLALSALLHINIPASERTPGELEASTKEPIRVSVSKLLEGGRGNRLLLLLLE